MAHPGAEGGAPEEAWRSRFIDYFVVCGLGLDLRTVEGQRGFQGLTAGDKKVSYTPTWVDRYPEEDHKKFEMPGVLPLAVLPCGVQIHSKGPHSESVKSMPKSYPIILTDSSGAKIYVAVLAFRDLIDEEFAAAYSLPLTCFADKCICIVSHWPFLDTYAAILEEIQRLCFRDGCTRPAWEMIAGVMHAPLPPTPDTTVLFSIQDQVYPITLPAEDALPQVSFLPLIESLDINNILKLFAALLLEKKILLLGTKYKLLTLVAEALVALLYPFKWMLMYIPVLPIQLQETLNAPGIYLCGMHRDALTLRDDDLDEVVIADLDSGQVRVTPPHDDRDDDENFDELPRGFIPDLPEPEASELRMTLELLLHPHRSSMEAVPHAWPRLLSDDEGLLLALSEPGWGEEHDSQFRIAFITFMASLLMGYKDYVIDDVFIKGKYVFVTPEFVAAREMDAARDASAPPASALGGPAHGRSKAKGKKKKKSQLHPSRSAKTLLMGSTGGAPPMQEGDKVLSVILSTNGWNIFFQEQTINGPDVPSPFDAYIACLRRGEPLVLPPPSAPIARFLTIPEVGRTVLVSGVRRQRLLYSRFPAAEKSPEQAAKSAAAEKALRVWMRSRDMQKTKSIRERGSLLEMRKLDTALRMKQHFDRLHDPEAADRPQHSEAYHTIYGILDGDFDGIAPQCLLDFLRDSFHEGWRGDLRAPLFAAYRELAQLAVAKAGARKDHACVGALLDVGGGIYFRSRLGVRDYLRRSLGDHDVWRKKEFWASLLQQRLEDTKPPSAALQAQQAARSLQACAFFMLELGLEGRLYWDLLSAIAAPSNTTPKQLVALRGVTALVEVRFTLFASLASDPGATDSAAEQAPPGSPSADFDFFGKQKTLSGSPPADFDFFGKQRTLTMADVAHEIMRSRAATLSRKDRRPPGGAPGALQGGGRGVQQQQGPHQGEGGHQQQAPMPLQRQLSVIPERSATLSRRERQRPSSLQPLPGVQEQAASHREGYTQGHAQGHTQGQARGQGAQGAGAGAGAGGGATQVGRGLPGGGAEGERLGGRRAVRRFQAASRIAGKLITLRKAFAGDLGGLLEGGEGDGESEGDAEEEEEEEEEEDMGAVVPRGESVRMLGNRPWKSRAAEARRKWELGLRELRGHTGAGAAVTTIHVGSASELPGLLDGASSTGYFVTGAANGTVKLWDPERAGAEMRATFRGHAGPVRALASTASCVASAGEGGRVLLHDKRTALLLGHLRGHAPGAPVACLRALCASGTGAGAGAFVGCLVSGGWDGQVLMWDLRAMASPAHRIQGGSGSKGGGRQGPSPVLCCAQSTEGEQLIATGHVDGLARVFDLVAGKERCVLAGHSNWVTSIQVVGGAAVTGSKDWTARLWDVHGDADAPSGSAFNLGFGSSSKSGASAAQCRAVLVGHTGALNSVDCVRPSPGEPLRVGTCSDDGTALMWSTREGEGGGGGYAAAELSGAPEAHPLQEDPPEPRLLFFQRDPMLLVKQSPRAGVAATVGSGNAMRFFEHEPPHERGAGLGVGQGDGGVWRPLQALDCFPDTIRAAAVDTETGRVCTGSRSGTIRIWDAFDDLDEEGPDLYEGEPEYEHQGTEEEGAAL